MKWIYRKCVRERYRVVPYERNQPLMQVKIGNRIGTTDVTG